MDLEVQDTTEPRALHPYRSDSLRLTDRPLSRFLLRPFSSPDVINRIVSLPASVVRDKSFQNVDVRGQFALDHEDLRHTAIRCSHFIVVFT